MGNNITPAGAFVAKGDSVVTAPPEDEILGDEE